MIEKKIEIKKYPIRLGQFLKLADHAADGNEAKALIFSGSVQVNGEVELRRGRKLEEGDLIQIKADRYICS